MDLAVQVGAAPVPGDGLVAAEGPRAECGLGARRSDGYTCFAKVREAPSFTHSIFSHCQFGVLSLGALMVLRRIGTYLFIFLVLVLAILIFGNLVSLGEGMRYLGQMRAWDPLAVRAVDPQGPFGVCYELVGLTNAGRLDVILRCLRDLNLAPILMPLPDEPLANVLVLLHDEGPYTVFAAHYDKSRETPAYQGASDNTAAVCALLAAVRDLTDISPIRPVAFLFTAAEERGSKGARSFLHWAQAQGMEIGEVINFDMIGRGKLATRPSAWPGFYFWLPGLGQIVYDGRNAARGQPYAQVDAHLISRLKAILGHDLVVYRRFTAHGDARVFQEAGLPTVSVSSDDMYYLDLVWERDTDRIELVDEDNLSLAKRFVVQYALHGL